jgi:hypothetical protein
LDTYGTQVNVRKGMLVLVDKVVFHPPGHAASRIGCPDFKKCEILKKS